MFSSIHFKNRTLMTGLHVHKKECILESHSHNHNSHLVVVGNGSHIHVTKTCRSYFPLFNLHCPLYLHNILTTSTIIKNLILICKFRHQNKFSIVFKELVLPPRITGQNYHQHDVIVMNPSTKFYLQHLKFMFPQFIPFGNNILSP